MTKALCIRKAVNRRTGHRFARFENQGLFATSATWFDLLEEVVTFVVNKNECREVFYSDFPYGFHSEFWEFNTFNALDVVLGKNCSRTADASEVESAMFLQASVTCCERLPFASITMLPPWLWNKSTYGSIRPAVVGPSDPHGMPSGVFAGPA